MGRSERRLGAFDLPGNQESAGQQENNGQPDKEMERIFENSAGIDEDENEPKKETEPPCYCQNRSSFPVTFNRFERKRRLGQSGAPD
jgi:hypothetical protein